LGRATLANIGATPVQLSGVNPVAVELVSVPAELADTRSAAVKPARIEPAGNVPVRIWNAHPMSWIVRPGTAPAEITSFKASAGESAAEPISIEESVVHKQSVAEPTAAPPPATPADPAREKPANKNAGTVAEAKAEARWVPQIRICAPHWRPPDVRRIVDRNIDHLRIGRLDFDRTLAALNVSRDHLLRCGCELSIRHRLRPHSLDGIHHIGLLCQKRVPQVGSPADIAI
jgi:hypothetical protein